jgi:hypothetical protein
MQSPTRRTPLFLLFVAAFSLPLLGGIPRGRVAPAESAVQAPTACPDLDGDGYTDAACGGTDCDDTNPNVHPGATEICGNGIDDDCNGVVDDGCALFEILSILDVGNDQGRMVRIRWSPDTHDVPGSPPPITSYSIYRKVQAGLKPGVLGMASTPPGDWDYVLSVPATGEAVYQTLVPTLCDSNATGMCRSTFFVRAHTEAPLTFYDTAPDSGYSVDNLAPSVPQGVVLAYAGGTYILSWDDNPEEDLGYYRIYGSDTDGFAPSPDNLVGTSAGPSFSEARGAPYYYQVTAVDLNGNESGPAAPGVTTGTGPGPGDAGFGLRAPAPNPFSARSSIDFRVPDGGAHVRIRVFDAAGRLVAVLAEGFQAGGEHVVSWDGRGTDGARAASGTYYVRMETASFSALRRLVFLAR